MTIDQLEGSTWISMGLQPLAIVYVAQTAIPEGFEIAARVHGMIRLYLSADGRGPCWCASPSFWEPLPLQQLATLLP